MKRYIKSSTNTIHYYIESNGDMWYSNGKFEYKTADWNNDGDVYTMAVMFLYAITSTGRDWVTADWFDDRGLKEISYQDVYDNLYEQVSYEHPESDIDYDMVNGKPVKVERYNWLKDNRTQHSSKEDREEYIRQEVERILKKKINENYVK